MAAEDLMSALYELWNYESRNLLADFPSKAEALAMARDIVREHR